MANKEKEKGCPAACCERDILFQRPLYLWLINSLFYPALYVCVHLARVRVKNEAKGLLFYVSLDPVKTRLFFADKPHFHKDHLFYANFFPFTDRAEGSGKGLSLSVCVIGQLSCRTYEGRKQGRK